MTIAVDDALLRTANNISSKTIVSIDVTARNDASDDEEVRQVTADTTQNNGNDKPTSYIFHRSQRQKPCNVVSGSGITFELSNGQKLIDGSAGPSVACLGHNQPRVMEAIMTQMQSIAYAYSMGYTTDAAERLAEIVLKDQPGELSRAIFVNSGSEATDAALKLASQYWVEKGQPSKSRFIARHQSYHGNTLGALSVSGHTSRREYYQAWMSSNVTFVDPCYPYRAKSGDQTDREYVCFLKGQLEAEILRQGPENVAAFVAETIPGTTLGCNPALPGYFKAVREICDKYDVLLILDEIMCGMGKTGKMHAWQHEGIRGPDIQTIGKALGAGFVPISGVLATSKIYDTISNGTGTLMHGHTFQAHPIACAAALEVQKIIQEDRLLGNVSKMGEYLKNELAHQLSPLPHVGDIRGRGLFLAVEFVKDPATRQAFGKKDNYSNKVVEAAQSLGLNILGTLGDCGKYHMEHVILSPPYIITASEVRQMVCILKAAIEQVDRSFSI